MRRTLALLLLLLWLPLALAQEIDYGDVEEVPGEEEPPDPDQVVETAPGYTFGILAILVGLAMGGVLAYVTWRQRREPPSP